MAALAPLLAALLGGCGSGPLRVEPLRRTERPRAVDARLALARAYAPILFHEVDEEAGRQDLPSRADFDGNLRGDDNWDHMARFVLEPTVYYAVLETATHVFLTYHVFHPRDWAPVPLPLHVTHENDGENLQVVVDKHTGRVVLLFTQAHYRGRVCVAPDAGIGRGPEPVRGPILLCEEDGRVAPDGRHAAVFVASGGHGIYGALDPRAGLVVADGRVRFEGRGLVLRPARPGEPVGEPDLAPDGVWPYALESTLARFWPGTVGGWLLGEGGLLDGTVVFVGRGGAFPVPRFYEADRFSGPFGPDRGISPFAVDFTFRKGLVGALFFDPARRWTDAVAVPDPWSATYVGHPFH